MEDDVARRVPRAMDDIEDEFTNRYLIAILKPAVGLERPALNAIAAPIIPEPGDPEAVLSVRPLDGHTQLLGEDSGAAAMIDMAVGHQQLLDCHAMLFRCRLESVEIAAGIDESASHRFRAPEQGAILLEGGHRDDRSLERHVGAFVHSSDMSNASAHCKLDGGRPVEAC